MACRDLHISECSKILLSVIMPRVNAYSMYTSPYRRHVRLSQEDCIFSPECYLYLTVSALYVYLYSIYNTGSNSGTMLQYNAVVQCCGTMLWYNAVVPAPTAVQCCGTMLWYQLQQRYNAVVQCCGTMLWYNVVVQCCGTSSNSGTMLWYNAVVQCCGTMLWYNVVVQCCGTMLWYNAVVQCCGTMLWYQLQQRYNLHSLLYGLVAY